MKRNYYSVRHIQRVKAQAKRERRLRLRMAVRPAIAFCIMAANIAVIVTWPGMA